MEIKEKVLHYMLGGHIHLSKKDYGFFSNLKYIIQDRKFITSNQVKLFDKLLQKYKRQFLKQGYDTDNLVKLGWKVEVTQSSSDYLVPKMFLENNLLCFSSPFNNTFLQYFKKLNNNTFEWNKVQKRYESEFSTFTFKLGVTALKKFYSEIKFDENLQTILTHNEMYSGAKFWQPTLIKVHQTFLIAAINQSLYQNIQSLNLNDDPVTLYTLSRYGVAIDESVIGNDNFKKFASNYYNTIDLEDLPRALMYLRLLEIGQVTLASEMIYSKEISKEVKKKIQDAGLECYPPYITSTNESVLIQYTKNTHTIKKTQKILKCITLTNSRPVVVK